MDTNAFKQEWIGRRVSDPLLGTVGLSPGQWFQCVSLIKQYLREDYNLDVPWPGNAIQFWTATNPVILSKFYRVESSEAQQGDIVILRTAGRNDFSGDGHIGIATGNINANDVEILEQNGQTGNGSGTGGDAIRTRYVARSRVAGLLRPTMTVAPAPPPIPYTIQPIPDRNLRINKDGALMYNLGLRDFDAVLNNPVGKPENGYTFVAKAILTHTYSTHPTSDYFLPDPDNPVGFWNGDCDDYDPTPPPYVPPTAPLPIPRAQTYDLVAAILGYPTATDAGNHANPATTLQPGSYYIYNTYPGNDNLINISHDNMKPGAWINKEDNVPPPPAPEPPKPTPVSTDWDSPRLDTTPPPPLPKPDWRTTYKPFKTPIKYVAMQYYPVKDLAQTRSDAILYYEDKVYIAGTFTGPDGVPYGRPLEAVVNPRTGVERRWWYGIRLDKGIVEPASVFDTHTTLKERQVTNTLTTTDYLNLGLDKLEKIWDVVSPAHWLKKKK